MHSSLCCCHLYFSPSDWVRLCLCMVGYGCSVHEWLCMDVDYTCIYVYISLTTYMLPMVRQIDRFVVLLRCVFCTFNSHRYSHLILPETSSYILHYTILHSFGTVSIPLYIYTSTYYACYAMLWADPTTRRRSSAILRNWTTPTRHTRRRIRQWVNPKYKYKCNLCKYSIV